MHIDRYAIGGLIYIIASQDLSTLGYPQSIVLQQLMEYWLSDAVQSNMSHWGASPLLPAFVSPRIAAGCEGMFSCNHACAAFDGPKLGRRCCNA